MSGNQERWDVVVKVLTGPMSGMGEQVLRGPVVRIGVNPGPGGLALTGYRGVDARHAVITAYDGGSATIGPVGSNQVRIAPHPNVNWKEIDPCTTPQYVNNGGAIHLGPIGRGATVEFVRCQRLGVWQGGDLASEAGAASNAARPGISSGPAAIDGAPPAAYDARKVGTIRTSFVPAWVLGCLVLMTMTTVSVMAMGGLFFFLHKRIEPLGPVEDGEYFKDYAEVPKEKLEEFGLLDGLHAPFAAFVMQQNKEASGRNELNNPENWDQELYERTAASVYQHIQWKNVFRRFEEIKDQYAVVTGMMQDAKLPEVFAGIPYRESQYKPNMLSKCCAKGYWQFMPEVAHRLEKAGQNFRVKDCKFTNGAVWNPTDITPPPNVFQRAPYITPDHTNCAIESCAIDDRTDLEKSTAAAIFTLGEAYQDELLRESGSVVQLTIASHNSGYDDSRFGVRKKGNMKTAFEGWSKTHDKDQWPSFYGSNLTCAPPDPAAASPETTNSTPPAFCGASPIPSETQRYVPPIIARHILAVCYYGLNHADMPAFSNWAKYTEGEGYCTQFKIPRKGEL
jgi:hypothetical protein